MLGAIAGDVIGSVFEHHPHKSTDFQLLSPACRVTDDSVLTIATARAILAGTAYGREYHSFGNKFPDAGYGKAFRAWLADDSMRPYGSWGNGSAMRVSPIGCAFDSLDAVMAEATRSAEATHDHPEGVKGAQAVAAAMFLARAGETKAAIRDQISEMFSYDLSRTVDEIRPAYQFDVSCAGSVPEAICCFLEANDFEEAVRLAISLGGDADTQAAIAGGIAEAFWGEVPREIANQVLVRIPAELRSVLEEFQAKYPVR